MYHFSFIFQALIRDERFMNKTENDILIMSALKSIILLPVIKAPIQCRILTVDYFQFLSIILTFSLGLDLLLLRKFAGKK